jgi:hypothetical protein
MNRQPRYSKEEHARRGMAVYEQLRPQLEPDHRGEIVAIDVDTNDFEVASDTLTATDRLFARRPDAQIWCMRVGYPGVHRFGPRGTARAT